MHEESPQTRLKRIECARVALTKRTYDIVAKIKREWASSGSTVIPIRYRDIQDEIMTELRRLGDEREVVRGEILREYNNALEAGPWC